MNIKRNYEKFTARAREEGITLIEVSLVLALTAIVLSAVVLSMGQLFGKNSAGVMVSEVRSIRDEIRQFGVAQSSYSFVSNSVILNAGVIPNSMRGSSSGSILSVATGGSIILSGSANAFSIMHRDIDSENCVDIIPDLIKLQPNSIRIRNEAGVNLGLHTSPFSPTSVIDTCQQRPVISTTLTFD